MALGSGLSAQLGIGEESTYGTAVSRTRFLEFNSESLALEKNIVQGGGLRASGSGYQRASRRAYTTRSVTGDIELDVATRGMGLLFKHMLGTSASAVISGSSYQQVHTPGALTGKSLTVQVGRPNAGGTVVPFTYTGVKFTDWELSCAVGEILTLSLTVDGEDVTTATGLDTATYTSAEVFHFAQGALVLGGTVATASGVASLTGGTTVAEVTGATISGTNPMKTDRFFFGASGVKAEPIENDWRTVTGSLDAEFVNAATIYDLHAADTETALRLTFTGPTAISGGNYPTLEVLIPSIRFDTGAPSVDGPDVLDFSADFTGLQNAAGDATIQLRYVTADTSVS